MIEFRPPAFWAKPPGFRARALSPFASIYGVIATARMSRKAPRAALPTIAVGGLTLGGDGKTPTALAVARILLQMGECPAFLIRGYRREGRHASPLAVDLMKHTVSDVGDEALLLAAMARTIIGVDREASARLATALGATALVLDDGWHSSRLEPDLAILVVDESHGAGNGYCPPAGPLRAPAAAQFKRADVALLIETPTSERGPLIVPAAHTESWRARLRPDAGAVQRLRGARVFAFAGIGRPEKFVRSLQEVGAHIVARRWFPDHHLYRRHELRSLAEEAERLDAKLVTTEKDSGRISGDFLVDVLPITLSFANETQIENRFRAVLQQARRKRAQITQ